jgi:tRNA nucleotidyltransferase (CCA-adding enzyme)
LFGLIPDYILYILNRLEQSGHEAWLVGGCVRDMIMDLTPNDYDIATSALPTEIDSLFKKTFLTGEKYGTVTVLFGDGKAEVTTYRIEGGYNDFRRPSQVVFTNSITDDLSRRDFTCNAIAYNTERGLYDPFFGKQDIDKRIINAVGDTKQRFYEDALRILRAFRFSAQLCFNIEKSTLAAAINNAHLLEKISAERIKVELDKILLGNRPDVIFDMINFSILNFIFNNTNSRTNEILRSTPKSLCTRWAAFFATTGYDQNKIMQTLKFDNKTKHQVQLLLIELKLPQPQSRAEIKMRLLQVCPQLYKAALELNAVLNNTDIAAGTASSAGTDTSAMQTELQSILESGEAYSTAMLAINGNDLIQAGFEQGCLIKTVLNRLLEAVIEQPELNERSKLLELAADVKTKTLII